MFEQNLRAAAWPLLVKRRTVPSCSESRGLRADALDLADGVALAIDRQQRRRLGEIDGRDRASDLRGDGDGIARTVRGGRRERVLAVRPLRAVIALAVPGEGLAVAGVRRIVARENGLALAVGDRDVHRRGRG